MGLVEGGEQGEEGAEGAEVMVYSLLVSRTRIKAEINLRIYGNGDEETEQEGARRSKKEYI